MSRIASASHSLLTWCLERSTRSRSLTVRKIGSTSYSLALKFCRCQMRTAAVSTLQGYGRWATKDLLPFLLRSRSAQSKKLKSSNTNAKKRSNHSNLRPPKRPSASSKWPTISASSPSVPCAGIKTSSLRNLLSRTSTICRYKESRPSCAPSIAQLMMLRTVWRLDPRTWQSS